MCEMAAWQERLTEMSPGDADSCHNARVCGDDLNVIS